jgi:UDP-N-acetylmuramyl pentapeptide phosphotransferase/UDP-N-acetylglucosamine-1-phosphate transferase
MIMNHINSLTRLIAICLMSLYLTWIGLKSLLPNLRSYFNDEPNERSSHAEPTPRGGGIIFVLIGILLSVCIGITQLMLVQLACVPLAIVGFIDDRYDQPIRFRLIVQLVTAFFLVKLSRLPLLWWHIPFVILVVISIINFVNFMDGLDGLVATCSMVFLIIVVLKDFMRYQSYFFNSDGVSLIPLIGSLAGFLILNWCPAKVFMGDVGSTFIGALLAGVIFQQNTFIDSLGLMLVSFPLFADALICILRRFSLGQNIFKPHRLHLFQRLHQAGWPHQKITILYATSTLIIGIGWIAGGLISVIFLTTGVLLLGVWLDDNYAIPFNSVIK